MKKAKKLARDLDGVRAVADKSWGRDVETVVAFMVLVAGIWIRRGCDEKAFLRMASQVFKGETKLRIESRKR